MGFSKCGQIWILNYTQWIKILDDLYNKQLKNIHYRLNIKYVPKVNFLPTYSKTGLLILFLYFYGFFYYNNFEFLA